MKDIKLMKLTVDDFKGQRHFVLLPRGGSCTVYGDNATGKSTLYDALTWLLFGKDSRGQSNFEIKPLGPDGQVLDHGAVTAVEAELEVDGEVISLRKEYMEKWSTKRGSATESYDGNTSEYYADGVPVKKYEFERRVAELVDEGVFRALTDVSWFCGGMGWQERRKVLFEVCQVASDGEIMAGEARFLPLVAAMGRLSMEDYKRKLQAERKGLSGSRGTIPARMDECKKTVDDLSGVDFDTLRAARSDIAAHLERLQNELLELDHGALLDSKRNELGAAQNELTRHINDNERHRASQRVPMSDERPAIQREIERWQRTLVRAAELARNELSVIEVQEAQVEECRAKWGEIDGEVFSGAACQACGQSLPKDALAEAERRFNRDKDARKQAAVNGAEVHKGAVAAAHDRRGRYIQEGVEAEGEIARLTEHLEHYVQPEQPEIVDLPDYGDQVERAQGRIRGLEAEVAELSGRTAAIRGEICGKVEALRGELDGLDREIAKGAMLDYARERMDALREEAQKTAKQLEELDQTLFLCEEFARHKVRYIDESINGRFQMVRFRLFSEQVNGGLSDCCDAMVDGVPYASLNSGARINAGVDVIAALSAHYGVSVPLVVDNAESVTRLLPGPGQVVRLVVSEQDKELRCEYGT